MKAGPITHRGGREESGAFVRINLRGEGVLRGRGRQELHRGVGGVASVLLKEEESQVERTERDGARKEGCDDGVGLFDGRDEGCR